MTRGIPFVHSGYARFTRQTEIEMLPGERLVTPSGDETGVADLASIQAAIDYVYNAGGGTVYFAPGDYYVAGTLEIKRSVGLYGGGGYGVNLSTAAPVTITHLPAETAPLFINYTVESGYAYIGPICGLRLVAGTHSSYAIYLTRVAEFNIAWVACMNWTVCVRCSYTLCSVLEHVYTEGNYLGGNFGLEVLAGVGQSTTLMLRDCRMRRHDYCISINDNACHSTWVDSCVFESCRSGIARLRDGHTVIRNAYVEQMNGTSGSTALVYATDGAEYELTVVNSSNTVEQSAPASIADGDTAITIAELKTKLLTMASSTSGRAPTVPTGAAVYGTEANAGIAIGQSLDWSFLNTGDQTVTITQATGHTLVGAMAIAAGSQGMFRTRCTAANTAITYRVA